MKKRKFKPNPNRKFPKEIFIINKLYNNWIPTIEDYQIIRERIKYKISKKPNWYKRYE